MSKNAKVKITLVVLALIITCGASIGAWYLKDIYWPEKAEVATGQIGRPVPPVPELQLYKPLLPEQAMLENEQLPFSTAPIERALPLVLPSGQLLPIGRRNAIDCLTSAIYYEAGNETGQGQKAVAQVILNRVRHPAFPNSICGVVYQGSERSTGCQFTFTCDGSLSRRPARDRWENARLVAIGAISGAVEPSVGMATHYHANYVLPYWAPSLDKISQIGSHIFYRWKGSWGKRRAFLQMVALEEEEASAALPEQPLGELGVGLDLSAPPQELPSRIIADDVQLVQPSPQITSPGEPKILADQTRSALTADEQKSTLKVN
ncbi:MAG: cell wall hydrolase [Sphingorhabdus sp.]